MCFKDYFVNVGPCYSSMVSPQVADRGDSLHIWKVAVNVLNKQLWTVYSGWSSSLWVGWGANNSP